MDVNHDTAPCAAAFYDETTNGTLPSGFPILAEKSLRAARKYHHLFVFCADLQLPAAAKFVSEVNRAHKLQALFIRSETDPSLLPQMLERAHLRITRNILVHSDDTVPRRVLAAWQLNAQSELIATAVVADDRLFVLSCEPKTYEVRFGEMAALRKIQPKRRTEFQLAKDGAFIWWPSADIHLDLDAIRSVADPVWRKKSQRLRRAHGREYGRAIAAVRSEHGLKQSELGGISERQLRRIESSGEVSVRNLEKLAKAHQFPLNGYLDEVAKKLSCQTRLD